MHICLNIRIYVYLFCRVYCVPNALFLHMTSGDTVIHCVCVSVWLLKALMYLNYKPEQQVSAGQDNKAKQRPPEWMRNWDASAQASMHVEPRQRRRSWSWSWSSVGTWSWDRMSTHQMHVKVPHWESQSRCCFCFFFFFLLAGCCSSLFFFGLFPEKTSH